MSYQVPPIAIQSATVTLTSAQLKTLAVTPVTLTPAPGTGKLIAAQQIVTVFKANTTPYSILAGAPSPARFAFFMPSNSDLGITLRVADAGVLSGADTLLTTTVPSLFFSPISTASNQALSVALRPIYGPISTFAITSGGAGYIVGDTGLFNQGSGSGDAAFAVDAVDGAGAVTAFHLTNNGSAYGQGDNTVAQDHGGPAPLQITVTAVSPVAELTTGDGTLTVTVYYSIVDVS